MLIVSYPLRGRAENEKTEKNYKNREWPNTIANTKSKKRTIN